MSEMESIKSQSQIFKKEQEETKNSHKECQIYLKNKEKSTYDNDINDDNSNLKKKNIDDYVILKILGKGSYAKVVLAKQKSSGRKFAIKILNKNFLNKVK
jgi:hypothetical protein